MHGYGANGYAAYQRTDVLSLTPVEIVSRLFTALTRAIEQAKDAMEKGRIALKGERIGRALSLVGELQASLNLEEGGEIARNLYALYTYITMELTYANLKNDRQGIENAERSIAPIAEAWRRLSETERRHECFFPQEASASDIRQVQIAL